MAYLNGGGEWVFTGREHNSVRRTRPCLEGRPHRFEAGVCRACGDGRSEAMNCWFFNCGPEADQEDGRWVTEWPRGWRDWADGERTRTVYRRDTGACDWCVEKHRREDAKRARFGERERIEWLTSEAWYQRRLAAEERRKEREAQWQLAREARQETRRQRLLLREGHETMKAIRRRLRGQDPLPPLASTPERSSPTS